MIACVPAVRGPTVGVRCGPDATARVTVSGVARRSASVSDWVASPAVENASYGGVTVTSRESVAVSVRSSSASGVGA